MSVTSESPAIDFKEIRGLNGRQSEGFEELVCQLAGLEPRPGGSEFIRKGRGRDAGLECFVRLADGTELGWQVKYYWAVDFSLISSLNDSLDAALAKHPRLTTITVCLPFDLSDARGKAATPRQQYEDWRKGRMADAKASGRAIEILLWDAHALGERLASDDPRVPGRRLYWFGTKQLTKEWFADHFERSKANLGRRYTAETSVALPIRRALLGLARDPALLHDLADHRSKMREAAEGLATAGLMSSEQAATVELAARSLDAIEETAGDWPIDGWRKYALSGLEVARDLYHASLQRREADSNKGTKDTAGEDAIRRAINTFETLADFLAEREWSVAAARAVLVSGEAGAGKSHLLADACAFQLEKERPGLLFLGSSLTDRDVWPQLVEQLALPSYYTRETFLGALDAAGEAAGCRALLMIDAINERNGQRIWPDRLGGFLVDASKYPHVAVVLSCRSTYVQQTAPETVGSDVLLRLEHSGFSTSDARAFLALRGIILAEHPFLDVELSNPLFLRTCCDALERQGKKRFPKGIRGVTAVFAMFRSAVSSAIEQRMNLNSRRRIPERAIDALSKEIEQTRNSYITFERACEIVDAIHSGAGGNQESDLLHQLEAEGIIAIEPAVGGDESGNDVRFTFERFADHVVAGAVIEQSLVDGKLPTLMTEDCALALACMPGGLPWGVREALAVQLPERTGVELPDALQGVKGVVLWNLVNSDTVRIRAPSSITERTLELLADDEQEWDVLIRLSIDQDSEFNATWLHDTLWNAALSERDADWSTFVANTGDDSSEGAAASDLIAWARDPRVGDADPEVASSVAIVLTWFLSTSNRRARDTATLGLVNLIAAFPSLAVQLLDRFDGVDDPYVGERLAAAIYGAALQGRWELEALEVLVRKVVQQFFERGPLPLDILWRDHLASLLDYAEMRGCRDRVAGQANVHPPFESPWPLEAVPDAVVDAYKRTYQPGVVFSDEIVSSTSRHGDFGHYIIGHAVLGWNPARRGSHAITSEALYRQWRAEFDTYATPEMLRLFEAMDVVRAKGWEWTYASGTSAEEHQRLESEFREALGTERFEHYRVTARHWRPTADRVAHPADFDVEWVRRWVCMRAHTIGWDEKLHGEFDRSCGHGRNEHTRERIGKKYQWIALRELMARISDNCAPKEGDWLAQYRQTVRRFRHIDPSRLMEGSHDWGWAAFRESTFWMPFVPRRTAFSIDEATDWLERESDVLDGPEYVELRLDRDGRKWLPLGGFQHFRLPGTTQDSEGVDRSSWMRLACIVVRSKDEDAALRKVKGTLFLGDHDLIVERDGLDDWYLGEYDWRNDRAPQWTGWWGKRTQRQSKVEAAATTVQLLQEAGNYDHSLTRNFSVRLPAPWLVHKLGLRLADGRTVRYVDAHGRTQAFDPSAEVVGPSTTLVDRDRFLSACRSEELSSIWVLGGAKEVYSKDPDRFGRRNWTSVYSFDDQNNLVRRSHHLELEGDFPGLPMPNIGLA